MTLVSKTFDQLLDFTRTTSGTFVGSNGLIQTTPASVNLLTQTQQFDNADWTKNAVTVTANTTIAPDGTSTADTITESATTDLHVAFQTDTLAALTTHTLSVYVKAGTRSFAMLRVGGGGFATGPAIKASLTGAGSTTTLEGPVSSSAIISVGNGWYRVSMTFVSTATTAGYASNVGPHNDGTAISYLGNGSTVFIWGAQLETGSTATTYTRNNGGVYPPRFDYDPVSLQPKGILIEEQRVNLLTYSAQFDNVIWTKVRATVTADATTSPNGAVNADKLVENTDNNTHYVEISPTVTAAAHSFSVFLKADERGWARLVVVDGAAYFNLSTGAVGTVSAGSVSLSALTPVNMGNGWYRCTVVFTPSAGAATLQVRLATSDGGQTYTGDGTSGIFLWGAQLEAGAFPTSYIPTVASQVTRARDQCSIVAPNFAPWYNQSAGTLSIEASLSPDVDSGSGNYYAAISDGTTSNAINILDINGTRSQIVTGNVTEFSQTVGAEPTGILKAALAYKTNDVISCVDGTLGGLDTSVTLPTVTGLLIGIRGDASGSTSLNGHIRSIRYYPVRLSDAQLQALTA
jgi:hypothetical protein